MYLEKGIKKASKQKGHLPGFNQSPVVQSLISTQASSILYNTRDTSITIQGAEMLVNDLFIQ